MRLSFTFIFAAGAALLFPSSAFASSFDCPTAQWFANASGNESDKATAQEKCFGKGNEEKGSPEENEDENEDEQEAANDGGGEEDGESEPDAQKAGYSNLGEYYSQLPKMIQEQEELGKTTEQLHDFAAAEAPKQRAIAQDLSRQAAKSQAAESKLQAQPGSGPLAGQNDQATAAREVPDSSTGTQNIAPLASADTEKLSKTGDIDDAESPRRAKGIDSLDLPGEESFYGALSRTGKLGPGSGLTNAEDKSAISDKAAAAENAKKHDALRDKLARTLASKDGKAAKGSADGQPALAAASVFDEAGNLLVGKNDGKGGFRMDGSETDVAIHRLTNGLDDEQAGILGRDSLSLFARVSATYRNSVPQRIVTR